jgi:DNA-binding transcriptional regulator YhcF (GntR family)
VNGIPAAKVAELLIDKISRGDFPLGSRLPTSRQLAVDLGVHRNTVSKAYRALAEQGIVYSRQGRGTFLIAMPSVTEPSSLVHQIDLDLSSIIQRARRLGVEETELRRWIDEQVSLVYRRHAHRVAFVECNDADTMGAINEIEAVTGYRLDPLLLSQLTEDPDTALSGRSVISTSLFHLEEVSDIVSRVRPGMEVVGVNTEPDERALQEIAQIPSGSRVGIVVSNVDGARRYAAQISTVANVETQSLVSPSIPQVSQLASNVDVLVCSRSQFRLVKLATSGVPIIELPFHVSRSSANRITETMLRALDTDTRDVVAVEGSPP